MLSFLQGKKTYIVALAGAAYAVAQFWSGAIDVNALVAALVAAAGAMSLRHGISTSSK